MLHRRPLSLAVALLVFPAHLACADVKVEHHDVSYQPGMFDGWPANNGLWTWDGGAEVLVGFTRGKYVEQPGHGLVEPYDSLLARSTDGGVTWSIERPDNFVGRSGAATPLDEPIDFTHADFAMRVVGDKYHDATKPAAEYLFSTDRGRTWRGPHLFVGLDDAPQIAGMDRTPRTDYVVLDADSCLVFLSVRTAPGMVGDRTFMARTDDGGRTWRFVSWVIGPDDEARAVMPATVRLDNGTLVTALRRRLGAAVDNQRCWIDVCISTDGGATWSKPRFVGDAGDENGNPPALAKLADGRLAVAYASRGTRQLLTQTSDDGGATWSPPVELRADYHADSFDVSDLGYCRLFQRPDGKLAALYYWATTDRPEPHIECTIWRP